MNWFRLNALLNANGVLGINRRNAEYMLPHNPRACYPLVDDKTLTKQLAARAGVAVPELYGVIEIQQQVRTLPQLLGKYRDFVIKPARGSQGDGIIVVTGRTRNSYRIADGSLMDEHELGFHVSNILAGIYSKAKPHSIRLTNADLINKKLNKDSFISLQNIFSVSFIRAEVAVGIVEIACDFAMNKNKG